jgi:hypothetical protein
MIGGPRGAPPLAVALPATPCDRSSQAYVLPPQRTPGVIVVKGVVLLLAVSVPALYAAERYSVLTQEEIAYVYHPATDNVYTVVFGTAPDRSFKKYLLLPFHSPPREIKVAEERGSMTAFLRQKAARDTLFLLHRSHVESESVSAQVARFAGPQLDSVRIFGYRWDFPDLAWVPRRDLETPDLLPLELSVILPARTATWFWDDAYPVDAVVVKEQHRMPSQASESAPNTVEVLEEAIMIRGEAARYLEKVLFSIVR